MRQLERDNQYLQSKVQNTELLQEQLRSAVDRIAVLQERVEYANQLEFEADQMRAQAATWKDLIAFAQAQGLGVVYLRYHLTLFYPPGSILPPTWGENYFACRSRRQCALKKKASSKRA